MSIRMNECCVPEEKVPEEFFESKLFLNVVRGLVGRSVQVEKFPLEFEGYQYEGVIAFPAEAMENPAPVVLVFPNYAGLKEFDVDEAKFLAQLGYVGLAVDLYKSTKHYPRELRTLSPKSSQAEIRQHMFGSFSAMNDQLKRPKRWRALMSEYLVAARKHPAVHQKYAAALGYCFGGQCCLEMVRNGDDLQGVISFHGLLQSRPLKEPLEFQHGLIHEDLPKDSAAPNHYAKDCKILICNGDLDTLVSKKCIATFEEEMKMNNINDWQFQNFSNTDHGFALAPGVFSNKYSSDADRRSCIAMIHLLEELWGGSKGFSPKWSEDLVNACGTKLHLPLSKL